MAKVANVYCSSTGTNEATADDAPSAGAQAANEESSMNADKSGRTAGSHQIRELLSEDETERVIEEAGGRLSHGEEYVDLAHLSQGVHRALTSDALNMKDFIRRRAVSAHTWSRICSTLMGGAAR